MDSGSKNRSFITAQQLLLKGIGVKDSTYILNKWDQ